MKRLLKRTMTCITIAIMAVTLAEAGDDKKDDTATWDVNQPEGDWGWHDVAIDTDEMTWSNVDVSPDGSSLVFDMLGDLYTVPMTGGDAEVLVSGVAWDFQPRFSPDGRQVAFISDRGGADNLWLVNVDGSDPRALTEEDDHTVHNPSWSPDGLYIAAKKGFTTSRSIPAGEIWMVHIGGGAGVQLVARTHGDKDQKNIAEPSFSPDGRFVYYSQDATPGHVWQYNKDATGSIFAIKRLERSTGEVVTLVSGPGGAVRPVPSPDGRLLAFVKRLSTSSKSAIYLKDLDSGKEWSLYEELDRDLQESDGCMGNAPAMAWTPDSTELVFWAGGKIRRVEVASGETSVIPIHISATRQVAKTLRFPVEVDPDEVKVRMIRWAQLSPVDDRIAFQALGALWIYDSSTGSRQRVADEAGRHELYPVFSPDGSALAYTTWDDDDLGTVAVLDLAGGTSHTVTREPGHYVEPSFSADGTWMVYRKITGGYLLSGQWSMDPGIYLAPVNPADGEVVLLSRTGVEPHFDADGQRVFFSEAVKDAKLQLKSVNLTGKDGRTHLEGKMLTELEVSPDGRWVAFCEQFNAYVAPFPRTGKMVEIGPESKAIPVRQVSARAGEFLRWSADSSSLHWANGATLYERELSDAFAFLDGAPETLPEPVETGLDLSFEVAADRPSGITALVGGRVVTMRDAENTEEVIENGVVVVDGHRIRAVGTADEVKIPAGATVFDISGKTVVPGFVDAHAHGPFANEELTPEQNWLQLANLAFGVTTVHDPSNDTSAIFSAAEMQRAGLILAPRIFSTGTILYGAHAAGYRAEIEDLDDARFHVRRLKDVGAISVKSYQQPKRSQRQQIIVAARELGIMVVPEGGAKFQSNMSQIVDGHTGIEHAIPIAKAYEDVVQLWAGSEVGYTPTFVVAYGGISGENYWYDRTDVWKNEHLMRFTPRFLVEPRSMRRTKAPDEHYNHIQVARFAKQLRERGVSVQIGAHGQRAGLAAHWEMWSMVQGGFSPWQALRGATIDGARYLALDGDVGSIEVGKLADMVIIDGNPLEDLMVSEKVVNTMLGGRLYDAMTMNQVAPEKVERSPFFFEKEGGDTVHPATTDYYRRFAEIHGWVH